MSTGLKANSDGSAAIQVGGSDAIQLSTALDSTFVNDVTVTGDLNVTGSLNATGGVTGAITSGTAVASTSGTSIDFTGIPASVKRVTVMFSGVSTSGTSAPIVQLGTSSSFETSGYTGSAGFGTTNVNLSSGFFITTTAGAGNTAQGIMVLTLLNSATNTFSCSSNVGITGNQIVYLCGGAKALSAALTRVRITTAGGTDTFDAGTINILYE